MRGVNAWRATIVTQQPCLLPSKLTSHVIAGVIDDAPCVEESWPNRCCHVCNPRGIAHMKRRDAVVVHVAICCCSVTTASGGARETCQKGLLHSCVWHAQRMLGMYGRRGMKQKSPSVLLVQTRDMAQRGMPCLWLLSRTTRRLAIDPTPPRCGGCPKHHAFRRQSVTT